jgi:hypothetical protein
MAHIDFEKFYDANKAIIKPEFKILTGQKTNAESYISLELIIENGEITGSVSSGEAPDLTSNIPPMQSFIVTTNSAYAGSLDSLVITKDMSIVEAGVKLRAAAYEQDVIRIQATRDGISTAATIALFPSADNGYYLDEDSRRMLIKGISNVPNIYTIVDGMYLDINLMQTLPESLPIGISTIKKGETTIEISGVSSLSNPNSRLFLRDMEKMQLFPITDDDFKYTFNNTTGDVIGRFYLVHQENTQVGINAIPSKNIFIYKSDESIHVLSSDGSEIKDLLVYSVDGKVLYQQKNTGQSHIEIPLNSLNTAVAVVKSTTAKATVVSKIIIK